MMRNYLHTCCGIGLRVAAAGALVLAVALGVRLGLLEAGYFPLDCTAEGAQGYELRCAVKQVLVQAFIFQRIGWVSLALGAAAFFLRRRAWAWGGWLSGITGLVLYNFDLAAAGALLSLLVLARTEGRGERIGRVAAI